MRECPECRCVDCMCSSLAVRTVKDVIKNLADARATVYRLEKELSKRQEDCSHRQLLVKVCIDCFLLIDEPSDVVR